MHTVAGGETAVETDYLRHCILPNLFTLLAVILCRMDETEGNWGNRNMSQRVAGKSLARLTSRCHRTESIVSLERGFFFSSCYRG